MPENITLEQLSTAQNTHFAAQTADMNELKENTAALLSTFSELANRVYGYSHEAFVTKTLDAVYADIIAENPELAELSAVGFTALLKDGDTVFVQGNIMYINGTQAETDYTFSGENSDGGTELVNVWYFENNSALVCNNREFDLINAEIRKNVTEITIAEGFFNHAQMIKTNIVLPFVPYGARKQVCTLSGCYVDRVPSELEEYMSGIQSLQRTDGNVLNFGESKALKKVRFPELLSIDGVFDSHTLFTGCSNLIIDDETFPKLETIGSSAAPAAWSMFKDVPTLILPESITAIGKGVAFNNKTVIIRFRNAASVDNDWCITTPTEQFEMADEWSASINIAVAAANWSKAQFVDLFENTLRDMGDEVREIKIPSAIYDSLTDEEFALAEDKGWTVGA